MMFQSWTPEYSVVLVSNIVLCWVRFRSESEAGPNLRRHGSRLYTLNLKSGDI